MLNNKYNAHGIVHSYLTSSKQQIIHGSTIYMLYASVLRTAFQLYLFSTQSCISFVLKAMVAFFVHSFKSRQYFIKFVKNCISKKIYIETNPIKLEEELHFRCDYYQCKNYLLHYNCCLANYLPNKRIKFPLLSNR